MLILTAAAEAAISEQSEQKGMNQPNTVHSFFFTEIYYRSLIYRLRLITESLPTLATTPLKDFRRLPQKLLPARLTFSATLFQKRQRHNSQAVYFQKHFREIKRNIPLHLTRLKHRARFMFLQTLHQHSDIKNRRVANLTFSIIRSRE